jgi:hypothetical protein
MKCKHCGREFDPSEEFIENDHINAYACDYDGDWRFPYYCPDCIEKLYDMVKELETKFKNEDVIKNV